MKKKKYLSGLLKFEKDQQMTKIKDF